MYTAASVVHVVRLLLCLCRCKLAALPVQLTCLTQLTALMLPFNLFSASSDPEFSSFEALRSLPHLAVLSLRQCICLDRLPPPVAQLTSVKVRRLLLDLSCCIRPGKCGCGFG